jgi:hypothetical protein
MSRATRQRPRLRPTLGERIDMLQRMRGACYYDGCARQAECRGLCKPHHVMLRRRNDPLVLCPLPTDTELLWQRFARDPSGCWLWKGSLSKEGYGRVRRHGWAHREMYELLVGPIPDGLTLDHLCRTTRCVNPSHLEPVTFEENVRRMHAARPKVCVRGHDLTDPKNLYVYPTRTTCAECQRIRAREAYYAKRAAAS